MSWGAIALAHAVRYIKRYVDKTIMICIKRCVITSSLQKACRLGLIALSTEAALTTHPGLLPMDSFNLLFAA